MRRHGLLRACIHVKGWDKRPPRYNLVKSNPQCCFLYRPLSLPKCRFYTVCGFPITRPTQGSSRRRLNLQPRMRLLLTIAVFQRLICLGCFAWSPVIGRSSASYILHGREPSRGLATASINARNSIFLAPVCRVRYVCSVYVGSLNRAEVYAVVYGLQEIQ